MAALTAANPQVVAGPPMATVKMLIENGESWNAGQFLYVDTGGLLNACASNGQVIKFLALTDQADPGNSTTFAEVGIITSDHEFIGNELDTTAASTSIGQYAAINVTSNVVTVDISGTSNDAVVITDLGYLRDPALYTSADTKAKLYFKILTIVLEGAPA